MKTFLICNAAELWKKETDLPSIPTFSQSLDSALGNDGIQLGSVTEMLGLPATGKTQLCLQLCASVQIPKVLGGLDAEALYVDTNTNFTLSRFREGRYVLKEKEALRRLHLVEAFGLEKFYNSRRDKG
ncbi:RAD51C protein [Operophtera brumata]|uniref:DNA repair protein RAD51 homolog 3 n=1 Tax=Operophtera brumata TaxID=104452 RepID=A0A0L7KV19_OPEBR|nr:RAD51C protein [Operophtera brumata]